MAFCCLRWAPMWQQREMHRMQTELQDINRQMLEAEAERRVRTLEYTKRITALEERKTGAEQVLKTLEGLRPDRRKKVELSGAASIACREYEDKLEVINHSLATVKKSYNEYREADMKKQKDLATRREAAYTRADVDVSQSLLGVEMPTSLGNDEDSFFTTSFTQPELDAPETLDMDEGGVPVKRKGRTSSRMVMA